MKIGINFCNDDIYSIQQKITTGSEENARNRDGDNRMYRKETARTHFTKPKKDDKKNIQRIIHTKERPKKSLQIS